MSGEDRLRTAVARLQRNRPAIKSSDKHTFETAVLHDLREVKQRIQTIENYVLNRIGSGIYQHYNLDEMRTLCFELGIKYGDIDGVTRQRKAQALIEYCDRHDLLDDLIRHIQQTRPYVLAA